MIITCKTLYLESFPVEAESTDTVKVLKKKIQAVTPFQAEIQRLMFKGKLLKDEQKVGDLKLDSESYLVVIVKPGDNTRNMVISATGSVRVEEIVDTDTTTDNDNKSLSAVDDGLPVRKIAQKQEETSSKSDRVFKSTDEQTTVSKIGTLVEVTMEGSRNNKSENLSKSQETDKEGVEIAMNSSLKSPNAEGKSEKNREQELVQKFSEMGFEFDNEIIRSTLINCKYDENLTAETLIEMGNRENTEKPDSEKISDVENFLNDPSVKELAREMIDNPKILDETIETLTNRNPDMCTFLFAFKDEIVRRLQTENNKPNPPIAEKENFINPKVSATKKEKSAEVEELIWQSSVPMVESEDDPAVIDRLSRSLSNFTTSADVVGNKSERKAVKMLLGEDSQREKTVEIDCKTLFMGNVKLDVRGTETVGDLKRKVQRAKKFPVEKQHFLLCCTSLKDEQNVAELNLTNDSDLVVAVTDSGNYFEDDDARPTPSSSSERVLMSQKLSEIDKIAEQSDWCAFVKDYGTYCSAVKFSRKLARCQSQSPNAKEKSLLELKFEKSLISQVLVETDYNIAKAIECMSENRIDQMNISFELECLKIILNDPVFGVLAGEILHNENVVDDAVEFLNQSRPGFSIILQKHKEDFLNLLGKQRYMMECRRQEKLKSEKIKLGNPNAAKFNESDVTAINEIVEFSGFSEKDATQAYMKCEKDKTKALDWLFEERNCEKS